MYLHLDNLESVPLKDHITQEIARKTVIDSFKARNSTGALAMLKNGGEEFLCEKTVEAMVDEWFNGILEEIPIENPNNATLAIHEQHICHRDEVRLSLDLFELNYNYGSERYEVKNACAISPHQPNPFDY